MSTATVAVATFAVVAAAGWIITAVGSADQVRDLRHQRDLARKQHRDAEARACGLGLRLLLTTVERDNARRLVHPSTRPLAPVRVVGSGASVTPIRKGER